jgi:preprotein translocase subunit SecD
MNNSSLWVRTVVIVVITVIALYIVFGPRDSFTASDFSYEGIKKNLANNINLGLDLKGGSHLVMRVRVEEYLKTLTENYRDSAANAVKQAQLPVGDGTSVAEKDKYSFTIPITDSSKTQEVIDAIKKNNGSLVNWTESSDANSVSWSMPIQYQRILGDQAVEQDLKIIESRINAFGVKEPTLQRQGAKESYQILLQMPGVENPERIKELIKAESKLELAKVVSPPSPSPVQTYPTKEAALQSIGGKESNTKKVLPYFSKEDIAPVKPGETKKPDSFVVIEYPAIIDGNELRDAGAVSRTGRESDYQITFNLKPSGATKFGEWTEKNINNFMAVVLNNEVKSIAFIKSRISDSGEISGSFTKATAEDLALTLKSGALPATIDYQEERTVGPSLGADSIRSGVTASIGGLVLVILFMLFYYRGSGVNAVVALVLNMILTLAALVVFKSTLTLPGIAGLILGIGMAVDSNVLIFERIREELRLGIPVLQSVDEGFSRAFITIIDTHITTIISSIILFMYGSGPIKGFAVTLILGLLINLFSAVFVSRTIFMWLFNGKQNVEKLSI